MSRSITCMMSLRTIEIPFITRHSRMGPTLSKNLLTSSGRASWGSSAKIIRYSSLEVLGALHTSHVNTTSHDLNVVEFNLQKLWRLETKTLSHLSSILMSTQIPSAGDRISVNGVYGTVLYVGSVQGTKGTWLGVDWDDATRGKHDGSKNGIKYFVTR